MIRYKLINYKVRDSEGTTKIVQDTIIKIIDSGKIFSIPMDEDNSDYREYLEWVAEGNTAEPADENIQTIQGYELPLEPADE